MEQLCLWNFKCSNMPWNNFSLLDGLFKILQHLSGVPLSFLHCLIWTFKTIEDLLPLPRHRETDLVGTVINVESGEWQRRDSGIGAGIDSYYEYLFKGYILLSDEDYLDRFNTHYKSIQKYIRRGTLWVDVHMHKPTTSAKNFMDALAAYWPGLQVLKGDLTSAIETHEMLYQVRRRDNGGFGDVVCDVCGGVGSDDGYGRCVLTMLPNLPSSHYGLND